MALGTRLAHAKSKLGLIERENEALRSLRKELKAELIVVNGKINESEILNKFLLENHQNREELFDKVLAQIKTLRELKAQRSKRDSHTKDAVVEFLTEEQKNKELLLEQSREMQEFLEKVKEQMAQLKVPNFENLVKNQLDLQHLREQNEQLRKLEVVRESLPPPGQPEAKKNLNFLRRSVNYKSTGREGANARQADGDRLGEVPPRPAIGEPEPGPQALGHAE